MFIAGVELYGVSSRVNRRSAPRVPNSVSLPASSLRHSVPERCYTNPARPPAEHVGTLLLSSPQLLTRTLRAWPA